MENFTPITSFIGGLLIGVSTSMLILFMGKIAGISGIVASLLQFKNTPKGHYTWRLLFIAGLLISSTVYQAFAQLPVSEISASTSTLIIAGLMVGFGSKMGSGCTSGHGVCGLSRLSLRSLIATMSFMLIGFVVTYLILHVV
ncbi:YeeE/YedE family protein [Methylotenera oryzisoli]|uniref:YeeE/YedE family protein n=1 Tax=Methylotenera oryzisoli TaxID=2080758 RepID=A0A4Y9VSP4_9PROT|nr:YeeE/YedE family protein [Methylotenera oryzisoli]TFW71882.1 YeeE/YedE family protein [Methylotenera oryzisoli]